MKKRTAVLLTSYVLAMLAVLGGVALTQYQKAEAYQLQLGNTYRHAFSELVSNVGQLDTALQKTLYAGTPAMIGTVCTEVYGKSLSASYALSEMPFSSNEFQNMSSFITRVGDYSLMLARKAGCGETGGEDEHDNLVKLSETATVLADNLNQLLADMGSEDLTAGYMRAVSSTAAAVTDEASDDVLKDSFALMEGEFPETPELIYDGPFSTHIAGLMPKWLEGKAEISQEEALDKASAFMDVKKKLLKFNGERAGNLPVYMFYANADGGTISIEVTKNGGHISDAFNSRQVEKSVIGSKDAEKNAMRFLEKKGYKNMKQSYTMNDGNALTVNFAYTINDVICYTDLIKVTVALDTGKIVGFDSQGFIMNHTERIAPSVVVDEDAAKEKVSSYLKILSHELTIIPTGGKNEVFCHEFKCESEDGRHYIVYINAETGMEEKILILLEDENGTLTI